MRNFIKVLGFILLCFSSCKNPNNTNELETTRKKALATDLKETILLNSEYNDWLEKHYRFKQWNPTNNDLQVIREILDIAIENGKFDFIQKPVKQNIEKYYRQYIPYTNYNGEKIIKVNAFCEILDIPPFPEKGIKEWTKMNWKNEYVMVEDGGDCYWQITLNIDTGEYKDLMVNAIM